MELAGIFISAFVVGLSGAMVPGSLLIVSITETMRHGFWAGPLISLGHALLELILVLLLVFGLGKFLSSSEVLGVVGLLGGSALLWFAFATWRCASRPSAFAIDTEAAELQLGYRAAGYANLRTIGAGMAASLSNPYWTLWWATIGSAYIVAAIGFGVPGIITFYTGHIASDFFWYSLVSWTVASGKKIISDHVYKRLLYFFSGSLFLLAFYFLYLGIIFINRT